MKVIITDCLKGSEKEVRCPKGGFTSIRILLKDDNMGYTMTRTTIPVNGPQFWHYKNHLESCYCVKGKGILVDLNNNIKYNILPGDCYVLDKNDPHTFEALEEVELICVFNPPLVGREIHDKDGSYKKEGV
jgi:L-ectoine synthase